MGAYIEEVLGDISIEQFLDDMPQEELQELAKLLQARTKRGPGAPRTELGRSSDEYIEACRKAALMILRLERDWLASPSEAGVRKPKRMPDILLDPLIDDAIQSSPVLRKAYDEDRDRRRPYDGIRYRIAKRIRRWGPAEENK